MGADELQDARIDLRPDAACAAPRPRPDHPAASVERDGPRRSRLMSSTGTTTWSSSVLRTPGIDDGHGRAGPTPASVASYRSRACRGRRGTPRRADSGRCVADSPMRCGGRAVMRLEPLQRQRQVRAALRAGQGVDLVDDDPLDAAQRLARLRCQQQVQRLGRRDEDVRRVLAERAPLLGGRVAGAHADPDRACSAPQPARRERDARPCGERRLRSTSWTSALSGDTYRTRSRSQRLAGTGSPISRSRHHRNAASVLPLPVGAQMSVCSPARDGRPALGLGGRRLGERRAEPVPRGGSERLERVGRGGWRWGAASSGHWTAVYRPSRILERVFDIHAGVALDDAVTTTPCRGPIGAERTALPGGRCSWCRTNRPRCPRRRGRGPGTGIARPWRHATSASARSCRIRMIDHAPPGRRRATS